MTNAGWYPDPAGAPNTYRYWDGQSWSQMTTTTPPVGGQMPETPPTQAVGQPPYGQPGAPQPPYGQPGPPQPPYGAAPPGQGGYGGPGAPGGYGQAPWSPAPRRGGPGKVIAIVVAAVLALMLLGVGAFLGVRALTDDDDNGKPGPDPTTSAPEDPTSSVSATGIQCTGGNPTPTTDPGTEPQQISGGGLTIPRPAAYTVDLRWSDPFNFANDVLVAYSTVTEKWASEYVVGGLPRQNGFEDPAQAAEIVMQCLTMNERVYQGFDTRTDLKNEAITVDGKEGHLITSEIRVTDPEVAAQGIEGDVTTVVVVDTGDAETYGLYIGVVPIGDEALIAEQESVVERISVG